MNADYVMLAEAASAGEGKQFIHGAGLRRIDAPRFPWTERIAIVARFTASLDEGGDQHEMRVRIIKPNGEPLVESPPFGVAVPKAAEGEVAADPGAEEAAVMLAIEATFSFPEPGWYTFDLALDSEPLASLRLRLVQAAGEFQAIEEQSPEAERNS